MKSNTFKENIAPVLVLVCICLISTFILAYINSITAPIIEANSIASANATRTELLPAAEGSFTEYTGDLYVEEEGKVYVSDCYIADNGSGVVMTVKTKSFGGILTEMVGIDADGAITGVKVTDHSDTPGLGTKAHTTEHLAQYIGLTELQDVSAKKDPTVDHITGASISSNAVHYGVYCALDQFKAMGGVN